MLLLLEHKEYVYSYKRTNNEPIAICQMGTEAIEDNV